MQELADGLILYHTSSRKQAESFIRTSVKKAVLNGEIVGNQDYGIISIEENMH